MERLRRLHWNERTVPPERARRLTGIRTLEDGQAISTSADYDYDMLMTVNATGKAVKITFPDFSGYEEIDPSQMGEAAA